LSLYLALGAAVAVELALPPSEDADAWVLALERAGVRSDDAGRIELVAGGETWVLFIEDSGGTRHRLEVAPVQDDASRASTAAVAASLLRPLVVSLPPPPTKPAEVARPVAARPGPLPEEVVAAVEPVAPTSTPTPVIAVEAQDRRGLAAGAGISYRPQESPRPFLTGEWFLASTEGTALVLTVACTPWARLRVEDQRVGVFDLQGGAGARSDLGRLEVGAGASVIARRYAPDAASAHWTLVPRLGANVGIELPGSTREPHLRLVFASDLRRTLLVDSLGSAGAVNPMSVGIQLDGRKK